MSSAVIDYYNRYNEESRLERDNYHRTEFLITLKLLEPYLAEGSKILDVGAGTGRYSCYYAERGHQVTALDLTPRHVEAIRAKAEQFRLTDNLEAVTGDACDLSSFPDHSFDAVLCMGPLYHLPDHAARISCLKECLRVLRPGGLLAAAYVNRAGAYYLKIANNPQVLLEQPPALVMNGNPGLADGCFVCLTPLEATQLMETLPLTTLEHAGTDGVSALLQQTVNAMIPEQYESWLELMMLTNRQPDSLGTSLHNLYIAVKK